MASADVKRTIVDQFKGRDDIVFSKTDCPHVATGRNRPYYPRIISPDVLRRAMNKEDHCATSTCKSTQHLWVCLACGDVHCGSGKGGHITAHYREHQGGRTEHCLALSCSTLTVWCHACDSYIKDDRFDDLLEDAEKINNEGDGSVSTLVTAACRLIQQSQHMVVFTGAGISTSAGLPDFRGPNGLWTCEAEGREPDAAVDVEDVVPTVTHKVIAKLVQKGVVQFVITQNYDNLHGKSGVPADRLAELHGNIFQEDCWQCDRTVLREYPVANDDDDDDHQVCVECRTRMPYFCHCTGGTCDTARCPGKLKDNIVHFGEEPRHLEASFDHAKHADLFLVVGSSLLVTPASDLPVACQQAGGRVIVVNNQPTGMDRKAALCVRAPCDEFMQGVFDVLYPGEGVEMAGVGMGKKDGKPKRGTKRKAAR